MKTSKRNEEQNEGFGHLESSPPFEDWTDFVDYDPASWPRRVERHFSLVPTVCFNCEAGCGLLAYINKDTLEIERTEGNPLHMASRGRNCAKGPATAAQIKNPDRILYPLRRSGPRGSGKWERVSWDQVLDDLAGRIRQCITEGRFDDVVYHVGRPGEDLFTERVLTTWGVDGHNSHTNVCSASARTGYAMWMGIDRPNPDHANGRFMLMLSAHFESGHYMNPHAQRMTEAKESGAKLCVIDTRLSNTAAKADYWLSPWPGTEAGLLLAIAGYLIQNDLYDREFLRRWTNWQELMTNRQYLEFLKEQEIATEVPQSADFDSFISLLKSIYGQYTPEWAEKETGTSATDIVTIAEEVARAGHAFSSHVWRSAAAGHLGGWMVARNLFFLNVLTGSVGTRGGTLPNSYTKFVPEPPHGLGTTRTWNETHFPLAYPLAHFEMSFLLPYLLEKRGRPLEVYFTRVHNPIWTNPDGFAWIDMLRDESKVKLHLALTPVWSETAQYADYVLPMGEGPERHDVHSYETHASQWIGFRQPVLRAYRERLGEQIDLTYQTNPGEVWEENEFWIELSWRIDPTGELGIRRFYESPYRPGEKITIHEYYRYLFEHTPGLSEAAAAEDEDVLTYMQRRGAYEITTDVYEEHERAPSDAALRNAEIDSETGFLWSPAPPARSNFRPFPGPFQDNEGRTRVGVLVDGAPKTGFPTPSGKLEIFSSTLHDWSWPELALPIYPRTDAQFTLMSAIVSQVHHSRIDKERSEYALLPTFRLPSLIHTRTNGAKWLYEMAQQNPVWINPEDAARIGVDSGDLVRVESDMGHFVDKVWTTEAIRPGVVACSHHLGRWRLFEDHGSDLWNSSLVEIEEQDGFRRMRLVHGPGPFPSNDADSSRIWWSDGGVHQNLIFPVQADPVSGQHCWHQKVRVTKAEVGDRYADVVVDRNKGQLAYDNWLALTRPAPGPGGMRRPYWLLRPLKPPRDLYSLAQH